MENHHRGRTAFATTAVAIVFGLSACIDGSPSAPHAKVATLPTSTRTTFEVPCTASLTRGTVACGAAIASTSDGIRKVIFGNQNTSVKLTSSNVSYNSATEIFQFDVTVQNLCNEAIGTPDGVTPAVDGIQVFFASGPTVTQGTGAITVANADGIGAFTNVDQPYFQYHEILSKDAVSSLHTWQLSVPTSAETFTFNLLISTDIQYLLVINEMLVNPGGTILDANGEWEEIYNAGSFPVNLQGLYIADSAASGRRPYSMINDTSSNLVIQPGAYFVLGNTKNTTSNGGVPVDYAYGAAMNFANSLDAFKISRVYGTDTLTIDRTQYASAATSAQDGISRELKNPALDNSNMDGSNWASASVTSVYGTGGRGTPKAQNSTFTPNLMVTDPFSSTGEDPSRKLLH